MITELYDALKEAGASEEKAKAAAQAIADYEKHFVRMESKLDSIESEIKVVKSEIKSVKTEFESEIKVVKAELGIIKWLVGLVIAGIISLIIKAFA
jgi:predicted  nucleic acid-binding Zn-ribbon protein